MPFGGNGPLAFTILWILIAVTLVFIVMRMYTRIWVVRSYGIDDHVFNLAFFFLVLYGTFITISGHYGFGQSTKSITNRDDIVLAMLLEAIGQTFAVIAIAISKCALGLFLLRIVTKPWHKAAIWSTVLLLTTASVSVCVVFWLQCTPPAYLWDRKIKGGQCKFDSMLVSMLLCILCIIVDFFFALFPWSFILGLQMNSREKLIILLSMSLGMIAGVCGIKRILVIPELTSINYLRDTIELIVWSGAEIAVTMICTCIPICLPLYRLLFRKIASQFANVGIMNTNSNTNKYSNKHHYRQHRRLHGLRTLNGNGKSSKLLNLEWVEKRDLESRLPGKMKQAHLKSFTISDGGRLSDNDDDEESLGLNIERRNINGQYGRSYRRVHGIRITEEYYVTGSSQRHK